MNKKLILLSSSVALLLLAGSFVATALVLTRGKPYVPPVNTYVAPTPVTKPQPSVPVTTELLALTNADRQKNGLQPLVDNPLLDQSALNKCNDMLAKNYWSHNAPDGTEPWQFIKAAGNNYHKAAENLSYGNNTSVSVEYAWMNSPEHKVNILDPAFESIGFGICKGDYQGKKNQNLVVEHFIQK